MVIKIGILDSGLGGHYALMDIQSHFPQYEYASYFDHENAPYGNKNSEEIFQLTEKGCKQLWSEGCDLILIACNTICSETLPRLQKKYSLPLDKGESEGVVPKKILGCVIPSVEVAVEISGGNIGLIATQFTIDSQKYNLEISKLSSRHTLYSLATPELASFVENGMADHNFTRNYLEKRIESLREKNIDTLILGCTHYSVFYEHLHTKYPGIKIVDSARTQTIKLGEYIARHKEILKAR